MIAAVASATGPESMPRGRGIAIGNSATTRPGRLESSTTRSPSRTASRTLWVTKSTVSVVRDQIALELVVEHVARHRVERAEGLVHQQHVGLLRERARDRDALAHAAGELVGPALRERLEMHEPQQLERLRRAPSPETPRKRIPISTFFCTVSHGNSADSWNISATRRPPTSIVPDVMW